MVLLTTSANLIRPHQLYRWWSGVLVVVWAVMVVAALEDEDSHYLDIIVNRAGFG